MNDAQKIWEALRLIYGIGARDRIREYMNRIKDGTLL